MPVSPPLKRRGAIAPLHRKDASAHALPEQKQSRIKGCRFCPSALWFCRVCFERCVLCPVDPRRGARRWVNCLLLREVPFPLAVRLWDTYVAEGARMKDFLTYVLAAFLLCWAPQLRAMDFQARIG